MNDYDKTGRYLIKRDADGFFRWRLNNPSLRFEAWIDARRVALPDQGDLTNDLVAAIRGDAGLEALCVELEAEARADSVTRLFGYVARFWTQPVGPHGLPLTCVGGLVLDLTGHSPAQELRLRSRIVPECGLGFSIARRHLEEDNATTVVAQVAAGGASLWVLGWVPLMRGGAEVGIIALWQAAAEQHLTDQRDRADLGVLTLTLSTLARCRPTWEHGLRRWNVQTSPLWNEIRAEGREQGLEQGREQGRAEGLRSLVMKLGREKFRKAPSKKQLERLEGVLDPVRLEELGSRLLHVGSWTELLAGL